MRLSVISAVCICLVSGITAAQQPPVFRSGIQTVPVYATVHDREGRLVPNLQRGDFTVLDNGKAAEITTFSNDILPITLALLLDMSGSMSAQHVRVRDAALTLVDVLLPSDRVRVGTFGDEIALSPWLTGDKRILTRILREEVWPGGGTPLWSALRAAMVSLAAEGGRRVVLVLSDGFDNGCPNLPTLLSRQTPAIPPASNIQAERTRTVVTFRPGLTQDCTHVDDVQKMALEAEFMVYSIGMEGPGLAKGLENVADETGGGHLELKRNADLATTFVRVADELHHQYALGFVPIALDGKAHRLEVQLKRPGLTARARKSYLAVDR